MTWYVHPAVKRLFERWRKDIVEHYRQSPTITGNRRFTDTDAYARTAEEHRRALDDRIRSAHWPPPPAWDPDPLAFRRTPLPETVVVKFAPLPKGLKLRYVRTDVDVPHHEITVYEEGEPDMATVQRKLGKLPKKFDNRTLQLARYLRRLPVPPPAIDHASRLPADIGMMGNDTYGDCTVAAAAHCVQSWSLYAERGMQTIPDAQIIAAYKVISPNDQGANVLDVMNYWRTKGIGPDRIEAFAEIPAGDLAYAKLAIQYFGSCYIGMSLPDQNTFGPWTTPTGVPNPYNGHAVNLVAYDDTRQMFKVITWGEIMDLSYAWYQKYADEGMAVLNDISLIQGTGKSPEGFDWVALQYDLTHIGDPVVVTPPEPVPVPVPPGPGPAPVKSITITRTGVSYKLTANGVVMGQHAEEREALEHAANLLLKGVAQSVLISPAFTIKVIRAS
jgi:hypothetical protein